MCAQVFCFCFDINSSCIARRRYYAVARCWQRWRASDFDDHVGCLARHGKVIDLIEIVLGCKQILFLLNFILLCVVSYYPNYAKARDGFYGRGAGCDFVLKSPDSRPSDVKCKEAQNLFLQCNYDRRFEISFMCFFFCFLLSKLSI